MEVSDYPCDIRRLFKCEPDVPVPDYFLVLMASPSSVVLIGGDPDQRFLDIASRKEKYKPVRFSMDVPAIRDGGGDYAIYMASFDKRKASKNPIRRR